MKRSALLSLAAAVLSATALVGSATPAHAVALTVKIVVDPVYLGATATVADSHYRGVFTGGLTSNGYAICGATSPQTVLAGADEGTGNPLSLYVPGTCKAYHASVTYNLQWSSIGGTSGHHAVHCFVIFGAATCSVPGFDLSTPSTIEAGPVTIHLVLPEVS